MRMIECLYVSRVHPGQTGNLSRVYLIMKLNLQLKWIHRKI